MTTLTMAAGKSFGGATVAAMRRTCEVCGRVTTPGGLGMHRKHTGHGLRGWTPPAISTLPARITCEVCGKTSTAGPIALHRKHTGHGLSVPVVVWEEGKRAPLALTSAAILRLPPDFRCETCGHPSGDLDEAEAHRSETLHLLYSERGVSEVWFYDLPNEAALFADA